MSGANFNITDLIPSRQGFNIREVHTLADLPTASGGFRDFPLNEALDIRGTIFESNVWRWPDESFIFIWTKYSNQATIFYTGADTFIQCAGQAGTTIFRNTNIFGTSSASTAKVFDLTASLNVGPASFGVQDTAFVGFPGGARYNNFPNGIIRGMVWFNNVFASTVSESLIMQNCGVFELGGQLMIGIGNTNQPLSSIFGAATAQGRIHDTDWNVPGAQSGIYLGSNITPFAAMGTFAVSQPGTGTFFKTQQFGAFQSVADGSTTGTVDSVSGRVTAFGTFAVFNVGASTTPVEEDIINHVGFAEASYNGKFKVHRVDADNNYQIALFPFQQPVIQTGATTGGTWDREYTLMNSSDTSELRLGFGVEIQNSSDSFYDGVHTVHELVANVSFSIQADFQGSTSVTGDFTVKSLDETNIQVDVDRAGAQKSSKTIALGAVNSRATGMSEETAITSNTYTVLNVSGFIGNIVIERFQLTDTTLGIYTYTGQNKFQGFVSGAISAVKSGAEQSYRFAMSLNGGVPLFTAIASTAITSVIDSPTSPGTARFVHAGTSPPVGSIATTTGFTVDTLYNTRELVTFSDATNFELNGVAFSATDTGNYTAAAANFILMAVKSTEVTVPLLFMAQLETGDTIQIMVAGEGTGTNINITDFTFGVF